VAFQEKDFVRRVNALVAGFGQMLDVAFEVFVKQGVFIQNHSSTELDRGVDLRMMDAHQPIGLNAWNLRRKRHHSNSIKLRALEIIFRGTNHKL